MDARFARLPHAEMLTTRLSLVVVIYRETVGKNDDVKNARESRSLVEARNNSRMNSRMRVFPQFETQRTSTPQPRPSGNLQFNVLAHSRQCARLAFSHTRGLFFFIAPSAPVTLARSAWRHARYFAGIRASRRRYVSRVQRERENKRVRERSGETRLALCAYLTSNWSAKWYVKRILVVKYRAEIALRRTPIDL